MEWNPFNWTADPFLALYLSLGLIIFFLGFRFRLQIGPPARATGKLGVLELAYLAGGALRLGDAVLLRLTSGHGASIDSNGYKITVSDQSPLVTLMQQPARLQFQPGMTRKQFQTAIEPIVARIQDLLEKSGYSPSREQMASFRMEVLPFVALLTVFGITKAVIGSTRHHPVGILVFLIVLTAFFGVVLATAPRRTKAGSDILQTYQSSNERASRAPRDQELLLALALSGPVVLTGTAHASVYSASQTMSSGGGGDGGGGCGGGGGGGGCGGCS